MTLLMLACTASGPDSGSDWELVWRDEFNGSGGVDDANWVHDVGGHGWGNNQLEFNTDRVDNAEQIDGFLVITAQREDYDGNAWTSARIKTQERFEQTNGRFEARIQLPRGKGFWPAFWMLGANIDEVGWPACGEIDILEARGNEPYQVNTALHGPGYSGGNPVYASLEVDEDITSGSHKYAVEWDDDHIAWFFDDQLVMTAHPGDTSGPWVYDHDFFLILNVAVGGVYLDDPDENSPDEAKMYVDYVRVYERL